MGDVQYTLVDAIQCVSCFDVIYSRARHDFHSCTCGQVSIDGGFNYTRVVWNDKQEMPHSFPWTVNASQQELFHDWNNLSTDDVYGIEHLDHLVSINEGVGQ